MTPLLAITFPAIDPVALSLGPLGIRWYAIAYIVGILLGWLYVRRLVSNDRLWGGVPRPSLTQVDDFLLWATLGIILGGRLGYVLFYNPTYFLANPAEIPMLWHGGMSFHGGFLGAIVATFLFARRREWSGWSLLDLFAAAAPIGLFFGRIANFVNSELWGRPTDVAWGVVFPNGGPVARHPSQLYEAALEGLVLFLVLRFLTHRRGWLSRPGSLAGAFTAGYGTARFLVEFFREPDAHLGFLAGGITMGQLLSTPLILAGLIAVFVARRRAVPAPARP